jgi:hypothetical protein
MNGGLILVPINQTSDRELNSARDITDTTVSVIYQDTLILPSFIEFDLPVRMVTGHDISAIALGFYFPEEYLEILDVELSQVTSGYNYNIKDSLFRLVWSNVNPISIGNDDTLVVLKMKTLDLSSLAGTIRMELYELSEFADQNADIIEDVILEIPEIEYLRPDTIDTISGYYMDIFPNPFRDFTTIYFGLEEEGKVKISLFKPDGMKMMEDGWTIYPQGDHLYRIFGSDLAKGTYILKFELINPEGTSEKVVKIISTW